MHRLPYALTTLALCAPAATAQLSFDYITVRHAQIDTPGTSTVFNYEGILVNTGTVPIELEAEWTLGALELVSVTGPINAQFVAMYTSAQALTLQPGEAIGSSDPLYTALLAPGETLVSSIGPYSMTMPPSPPNATSVLDVCIATGGQQVHFKQTFDYGPGTGHVFTPLSALRVSSTPTQALFEHWSDGCEPWTGPISLFAWGANSQADPGPLNIAPGPSKLPAVGNPHFSIRVTGYTELHAGQPWIMAVGTAPATIDLLGCPLAVDPASAGLLFASGAIADWTKDGYWFPSDPTFPLPIPNDPVLIGAEFWAQALLFSWQPAGALFDLSDATHLRIGACP